MSANSTAPLEVPNALFAKDNAALLSGILRGIEKESLRTTPQNTIANSKHPEALGSALSHPQITTDFSEALVEFITPPSHSRQALMAYLEDVHRFTYQNLGEEILWNNSIPCRVENEATIPIAQYGNSNRGLMKTIYRVGLSHRYGKTMQTVAGLHYNFSLPKTFWAFLHQHEQSVEDLNSFTTRRYFDLIRNFRRYYWLLLYLFGASPAMCRSFVEGRAHQLQVLPHHSQTLYLPFATSLRMGDLGYQSAAQEDLFVCYNTQATYVKTLIDAINTPFAPYEEIGLRDGSGNFKQLNTGVLQIENEFYSPIRPKRTSNPGETALTALCRRGVEYIEVRCLDLDPFTPLGFGLEHSHFIDTFLLFCLFKPSPACDQDEFARILNRQKTVVTEGRKPGLTLEDDSGSPISLKKWGEEIIGEMQTVAELLDTNCRDNPECKENSHAHSLQLQLAKVLDAGLTPSAQILSALQNDQLGFIGWAEKLSRKHREALLSNPLEDHLKKRFQDMATESLRLQAQEEAKPQAEFDLYLKDYYRQYSACNER